MSKSLEDKIIDKLDKALILARESTSPSVTDVMHEFVKKLDQHIETHEADAVAIKRDIAALKAQTQWISDTFAGGKLLGKISTVTVKFLIFVTAVSGSILWLKDWFKK